MTTDMLTAALDAHDAGLCVVRTRLDGSKGPLGKWKRYQSERPDRTTVERCFADGHPGIGYVTGGVSGNVEMIEFEGRFRTDENMVTLLDRINAAGIGSVLRRLLDDYTVWSPSGGEHMFARIVNGDVPPNTKIARRAATADELADDPDGPIKTLIETRGEGGFVIAAPSNGKVHPDGGSWVVRSGSPATIPTFTIAERAALIEVFATFDENPPPPLASGGCPPSRQVGEDRECAARGPSAVVERTGRPKRAPWM